MQPSKDAKNFDIVKEVINTFDQHNAKLFQNACKLFNDNMIKNKLAEILSISTKFCIIYTFMYFNHIEIIIF